MTELTLREYRSSHSAVTNSQLSSSGRSHVLLCLRDSAGLYIGEASPLPGYGYDSFSSAINELQALDLAWLDQATDALMQGSAPCTSTTLASALEQTSGAPALHSPSARFCVESVLLRRVAQLKHVPVWRLFAENAQAELPTSQVIDASEPNAAALGVSLYEQGVRTLKCKCGRDQASELRTLEFLRERCGDSLALRVDANRAWTIEAAELWIESARHLQLQWVEDPTDDSAAWQRLVHLSVPLAIDELLARPPAERDLAAVGALIVKPMALGLAASLGWSELARRNGLNFCVSHLFDGPWALEMYAQLAFALQTQGVTPGLSAHAALIGHKEQSDAPDLSWVKPDRLILPANP